MTETITAASVLAQIEELKDEVFAFTNQLLGTYDQKCACCGEPAPSAYYDCIAYFGGGFAPLCDHCYILNELLWELACIRHKIRAEMDALAFVSLALLIEASR